MFYIIDPLKADVQALTNVMSQEYALRNRILAVEIQPYKVLIATDQPYKMNGYLISNRILHRKN